MDETMNPSKTTTTGQIDKAVAAYRQILEKYALGFYSALVQQVLGDPKLAQRQFELFREMVEDWSDVIIRPTHLGDMVIFRGDANVADSIEAMYDHYGLEFGDDEFFSLFVEVAQREASLTKDMWVHHVRKWEDNTWIITSVHKGKRHTQQSGRPPAFYDEWFVGFRRATTPRVKY